MTDLSDHLLITDLLEVPDGRLYYEVRGSGPWVLLVGAPMTASAFGPLAELLATDHTVLTTDPRGSGQSRLVDPEQDSTPERRADDLSRLLAHLDAGPSVVVGSSGGAVTALALAEAHPEQVATVVAHEPPLLDLLEDRTERRAGTDATVQAYRSQGRAAGWASFLAEANIAMPEPVFQAVFGRPLEGAEASDEDHFFLHQLRATTRWSPDLEALRGGAPKIVVGLGADSTGQICDRTCRALASSLDTEPVIFPGGHTGFVDHPASFADTLRTVLGEVGENSR
jgi:pimeloyl-ACP methyl ester carboxylesterase